MVSMTKFLSSFQIYHSQILPGRPRVVCGLLPSSETKERICSLVHDSYTVEEICETMAFVVMSLKDIVLNENIMHTNGNRAEYLITVLDTFTLR